MTRFAMIALAGVIVLAGCSGMANAQGITVSRQYVGPQPGNPDEELSPFEAEADAMAEVDAALARAADRGTRALLVLGGNWCHDSRGLAWKLATPDVSPIIEESYELVYVDIGFRDKNLDVPERFGVEEMEGTPTVLVLEPDGELLNPDSISEWRTASSRSVEDVGAYFSRWARD